MKKIFTFLVAFLTTVSGAVWGQTYPTAGSGSGSPEEPYILDLNNPQDIGDVVDWHGNNRWPNEYDAFQIQGSGYFKVINSAGPEAISTYRIDIDNGNDWNVGEARPVELNVTLILDNVNIEVTNPKDDRAPIWIEDNGDSKGCEHNVTIQLEGKNSLTFKQDEVDGAAIATNGNSNLTITGDGYLRAEGQVGIGMVNGISGDIRIEGGTVVAIGHNGPGFGGSDDNGTNLIINGNTLVISAGSQGIGEMREHLLKGIYYDSTSGYNNAMVHGDVTLDSQFPSSEELQDILGSDLKIGFDVKSNGKLTLGEGVYFNADKLVNPSENESKLYAYKVTYDLNNNIKLGTTDYTINVNGAAPASIYAGPNVSLAAELPTATNTEQTWQAMAWGRENGGSYQEVTTTPATPSPITATANNNEFKATTIWAVKKWTTVQVTENGIMDKGFQLFYPQEAASLYTLTGGDALNQYGAKLGTEGTEKNQVVPDGGVTAKASDTPAEVTLTISGEDKTITIPFKVNKDIPNLKDATLTAKKVVYDGEAVTQQEVVESIKFPDETFTVTYTMYTVKFAADNEGKVGTELSSAPKDAGFYWVKAIAGEDLTNLEGETEYVKFEITKATATVTAADVEWTIGTAGPTFTDKLKATGVEADIDKLTVSITDLTGTWDKAGVYKVTYRDIKLNDDLAGNYNIPETVDGKLIVKKTGNGDDPIKPGDPDEDETEIKIDDGEGGWEWSKDLNGYYRTYDAESHPLKVANTIYVKQKDAEGEDWVAVPADAISVSYTFTEEQTENNQDPYTGAIKDAGDYVASITIDGDMLGESGVLYSGEADDIKLFILPFDLNIAIKQLDASFIGKTTNITADLVTVTETLPKDEVPSYSGTITVSEEANDNGTYGVTFTDIKLVDAEGFNASNYNAKFTYNKKPLDEVTETEIPDITPGVNTDIDDGDEDDNNWKLAAAGDAYEIVYDGNGHGIKTVLLKNEQGEVIETLSVTDAKYYGEDGSEIKGLPTNAGNYKAEVIAEGKTGIFSLVIKERPLGIYFDLTGLGEEYIGRQNMSASDFVYYGEVPDETISGLVEDEMPGEIAGTISIASEPNANGKYAVTFENIAPVENGAFTPLNYEEHYYLDGVEIDLSTGGNTVGDGDDDFPGIEIDDNTSSGGSGIGTKRYQLFLANKDYTFLDVKTDYADEGLELFSRHDKKYTKAGGSFTVWYEKDGVANAGGYRIFWSNKANGDYKEVKFDTVSEYFQIRNVQSNVYVKIYAADGFPVGNEEISAADYRAYAQPNKIVVITPQPTDVQIISMAGAVVATDKVTGQREFANLTEGVYIVRMGETVVKLQVRK